jgi:hypothetical protein
LADLIGAAEPTMSRSTYAVGLRGPRQQGRWRVEGWPHELVIGQPLPTLPLWLTDQMYVPLDLEASYEEACRELRIT